MLLDECVICGVFIGVRFLFIVFILFLILCILFFSCWLYFMLFVFFFEFINCFYFNFKVSCGGKIVLISVRYLNDLKVYLILLDCLLIFVLKISMNIF